MPQPLQSETITRMRLDPRRSLTPGKGDTLSARLRIDLISRRIHSTTARWAWRPSERVLRPARHGAFIAIAVYLILLGSGHLPLAVDTHAYWSANPLSPYRQSQLGDFDAYFYSPAFAQVLWPFTRLPWGLFAAMWTGILVVAVYLQSGRWFGLVVPLVAIELAMGNIHLLLGLAVTSGLVWPTAWAFALLTKITPGIGLLWFAARRELRPLVIAALATAAFVFPSFVLKPGAWFDWVHLLSSPLGQWNGIEIPVLVRLPFAAALVVWGARTDRRWSFVIGCWLALPALYWTSFAMLIALIPVLDDSVPLARFAAKRSQPIDRPPVTVMEPLNSTAGR
jgi:hypothetical protein